MRAARSPRSNPGLSGIRCSTRGQRQWYSDRPVSLARQSLCSRPCGPVSCGSGERAAGCGGLRGSDSVVWRRWPGARRQRAARRAGDA
ncbi:hypothetical protein NDU88_002984 [Pleurodeles waltl]|uniref:Uncharacterized protein n=1 Tax=Pleurodeles waltl TaxID=8319 RepID=A0AAV7LQS5_PLEWA|nr:hypothetical protein NDU88_002984 [Pleurodeles waltl]